VPFVRVSRDKRGYEQTCLFEVSNRRSSKPRLLYWFRTPPGIRVGREPFDEPVRRALEAQNPGVMFDWTKLASEGLPPPDVENWRERRRAEREAKRARRGDEDRSATADDELDTDDEQGSEAQASASVGEGPRDELAVSGAADTAQVGRLRHRRRGGRLRSIPARDVVVVTPADSSLAGRAEEDSAMDTDTAIAATANAATDTSEK
jgi:hypothetical protein